MTGRLRALLVGTALLLAGLLGAAPAQAHRSGESQLALTVEGERIAGRWEIGLHDLASAEPGAGEPADLAAARAWLAGRPGLGARLAARLRLQGDGRPCALAAPAEPDLVERQGSLLLVLTLAARCDAAPRQLAVGYRLLFDTDPRHQGLLRLQAGPLVRPAVFTADSPEQVFALRQASPWERAAADLRSGLWHIWTGVDHLLFLLCLLLPALQARSGPGGLALRPVLVEVAKVVTAFTVAHSVTLSLAALHLLSLPARFTESMIAASVVLAAGLNLHPAPPLRRWQAAFGFGLVHGFGFASAVDALGVPGLSLLPTLLGFNLGVELGQLLVVAGLLPVGLALRECAWYGPRVVRLGSLLIGGLALLWFVERAFDLRFMPLH